METHRYSILGIMVLGVALLAHAADDSPLSTDDPKAVALYRACDKNDLNQVEDLVGLGAPIDGAVSSYRFTPLTTTAYRGNVDILKFLVGHGANINLPDADGSTPLLHACSEGHSDCALALIAKGADVNLASKWGRTPLMYAAQLGNDSVVNALLTHKAAMDATCDQGPAISWAASADHLSTVKLLGDAGANPNLGPGNTALDAAITSNDVDMIDYLIGIKADVNRTSSWGYPPLTEAILWQHREAVSRLLAQGAKVDAQDSKGETALMQAARKGDVNLVRMLLAAHANVNATDPKGETALTWAGDCGEIDIIQLLKDAGAKRTDIHIIPKEAAGPDITTTQAWALAVGAIYAQHAGFNPRVLGGTLLSSDSQGMLKDSWGITDKTSLLKELDDLRDNGHHTVYRELGVQLDKLSDDDLKKYLDVHPEQAAAAVSARNNYRKWKERTGLAWDLCRSANLVTYGFSAGYLQADEAWERLMEIARSTQMNFSSWQEMSDNFLDGREIWDEKRDPRFDACAQLLLKDPNSPWTQFSWKTDLTGT